MFPAGVRGKYTSLMLRIDNLSKRYGDHLVFAGLTHRFPPGCYALAEEDSTGKSTLLGIVAGEIKPETGEIWIEEQSLMHAPQQAKARLSHVPQNCLAFPTMTGRELLEKMAADKQLALDETVFDLATDLGLEPHLDKRFEQMSTGTRRKVYLVAAALGNPAVIVADGPSDGLDAPARARLAELFKHWGQSRVVLFASHDADLVQACGAQRIGIRMLGNFN